MQFSKKFLIGSLVLVLALGWAYSSMRAKPDAAVEEAAQGNGNAEKTDEAYKSLDKRMGGKETPILVEAAPVIRDTLIQRVSAQGRVHAYKQLELVNEIGGRLVKFNVEDGDRVKAGDVIAEIDDREYRLNYEEKESAYLKQKANFLAIYAQDLKTTENSNATDTGEKNLDELFKLGKMSTDDERKLLQEFKDILAGKRRDDVLSAEYLDKAHVELQRAKISLEKCTVKAPFDGYIFDVQVVQGQLLNANSKLARLVNLEDLVVKAKVLESEIGNIQADRPASVRFSALAELGELEGVVSAISPFVNEEDKTVETIVQFKNTDLRVRPGMFAEVVIDAKMFENRLMVPKTAILPRDNRKVVFRISEDSRAKWEYVQTGLENDEFIEIIEGKLEPGDMVLTDNHFSMGHDTLVRVDKGQDDD